MLSKGWESFSRFSRRRWVRFSLRVFWVVYPISYILLTVNGDYHGPHRYPVLKKPDGTWVMRQRFQWQPFHARLDPYGFNWSGAMYVVPIIVDRLVWHRDKIIVIDDELNASGQPPSPTAPAP